MNEQNVVWFNDADATDLARVGGKGANLGRLTQAGFVVPPGFVVGTTAYSAHVESNEGLKVIIRLSVNWLDNCSYELKFDKILRNENKIELPKITMLVKIIETHEDSYIQETSSPGYNGVYRSEVTKIR